MAWAHDNYLLSGYAAYLCGADRMIDDTILTGRSFMFYFLIFYLDWFSMSGYYRVVCFSVKEVCITLTRRLVQINSGCVLTSHLSNSPPTQLCATQQQSLSNLEVIKQVFTW